MITGRIELVFVFTASSVSRFGVSFLPPEAFPSLYRSFPLRIEPIFLSVVPFSGTPPDVIFVCVSVCRVSYLA